MRRTTIFLPEELHERLRKEAFRTKTSMAKLIRSRLDQPIRRRKRSSSRIDPILKVAGVCTGPAFSVDIDERLYGG